MSDIDRTCFLEALLNSDENTEGDEVLESLLGLQPDEQRRVSACVNACRGITTEMLEHWASIKQGDREASDER